MLLFNAADEITDFAPLDVSQGIKYSAMKVYRLIVDLVQSGDIVSFENSSLFRTELQEFIRNLSRMADELLPFVFHFNIFFSIYETLSASTFFTVIKQIIFIFYSITSEDSRILRERVPEERKSDRAYFIFYMKVAYAFSLTFK